MVSSIRQWLALLQLILIFKYQVETTRVRLLPKEEPEHIQISNNYRMVFSNGVLYYLRAANISIDNIELPTELAEDVRNSSGQFPRGRYEFNSGDFMRKSLTINWFVPIEEKSAKQVWDDSNDIELARGPQVNQKLCGLQLDYMSHLVKTRAQGLTNTTEKSIHYIMHSFDSPRLGITKSNNVFYGDYRTCISTPLNIMRSELEKLDPKGAAEFFDSPYRAQEEQSMLDVLRYLLGPLVGFSRDRDLNVPLEKYSDKIRLAKMRYCLVGLRWPQWPNTTFYRRSVTMRVATCIPETCDSSSVEMYKDKIKELVDYQLSNYHSGYYIDMMYCLPDEKSPMRQPREYINTLLLVAFNACWFLLLFVATTCHLTGNWPRDSIWEYLKQWDLVRNFHDCFGIIVEAKKETKSKIFADITSKKETKNKIDLKPLEGIKVISSTAVITSHTCMVVLAATWNLEYSHTILTKTWIAMANTVCPAIVNNFFVITAILTSTYIYKLPKRLLKSPSFWFQFMFYRYLRIVPASLLFHWFLRSGFRFLGSGPAWDYGTSHTSWSYLCQNESIWRIVFALNNMKNPAAQCNPVGWYLANDIQFALLTPFIVLLYLNGPLIGHSVMAILTSGVIVNHVLYYYRTIPDPKGIFDWSLMVMNQVTDETSPGYVNPQYRCGAFMIGMSAGYVLHRYEMGNIKRWPKWFLKLGKLYCLVLLYLLCFMTYITSMVPLVDDDWMRVLASIFSGTIHPATAIGASILIIFLTTGELPIVAKFFSMKVWIPFANTALSSLLLHMPLMYYHSQIQTSLSDINSYVFYVTNFLWIIESLVLSIPIYIMYELPLRRSLVKIIMNRLVSVSVDEKDKKS